MREGRGSPRGLHASTHPRRHPRPCAEDLVSLEAHKEYGPNLPSQMLGTRPSMTKEAMAASFTGVQSAARFGRSMISRSAKDELILTTWGKAESQSRWMRS